MNTLPTVILGTFFFLMEICSIKRKKYLTFLIPNAVISSMAQTVHKPELKQLLCQERRALERSWLLIPYPDMGDFAMGKLKNSLEFWFGGSHSQYCCSREKMEMPRGKGSK